MKQPAKGPRGRPRGFDIDDVIAHARDAFWDHGYAATSLDDLSAVTGLARPSLYAAFGDKEAMYLKALESFEALMRDKFSRIVAAERPLHETLSQYFSECIALYRAGESGPRGCFGVCTATSAAIDSAAIRSALLDMTKRIDAAFESVLQRAVGNGELPIGADPKALARLAGATLHSIAVRARAGESAKQLRGLTDTAIAIICGRGSSYAAV